MALFVANNGSLQTVKGIYYGMTEDYINATLFHNLVPATAATEIRFLYASDNPDLMDYQKIGYCDVNNFVEVWKNGTKYIIINPRKNYIYAPISCMAFLQDYQALTYCLFDNFDTSNTTSLRSMFNRCFAIEKVDLRSFNTRNVSSMRYMFFNCFKLTTIISNTFDTTSLNDSLDMFYTLSSLVGGNGTTYSPAHRTAEYARIDGEDGLPGYFTAPTN